jgi:hypothetical protein
MPPKSETLKKMVLEMEEAVFRDMQFINQGKELLTRAHVIAQTIEARVQQILKANRKGKRHRPRKSR